MPGRLLPLLRFVWTLPPFITDTVSVWVCQFSGHPHNVGTTPYGGSIIISDQCFMIGRAVTARIEVLSPSEKKPVKILSAMNPVASSSGCHTSPVALGMDINLAPLEGHLLSLRPSVASSSCQWLCPLVSPISCERLPLYFSHLFWSTSAHSRFKHSPIVTGQAGLLSVFRSLPNQSSSGCRFNWRGLEMPERLGV
jgi:hypothetical protein